MGLNQDQLDPDAGSLSTELHIAPTPKAASGPYGP